MADVAAVAPIDDAGGRALTEPPAAIQGMKQQPAGIGSDASDVESDLDLTLGMEWQDGLARCVPYPASSLVECLLLNTFKPES